MKTKQINKKYLENLLYKDVADIARQYYIKVKGKKHVLIEKILKKVEPTVSKTKSKKVIKKPIKKVVAKKAPTKKTPATPLPQNTVSEVQPQLQPNTGSSTEANTANGASHTQDGDPDNQVIALRLNREGCNTGELHISLIWNDVADLDLHVIEPGGEHLYFGHKESKTGGWLDRDMNVSVSSASTEPIENVFWASAPSGKYKVYVDNYNCHTRQDFPDQYRSVPFRVRLIRGNKTDWFDGSLKNHEKITAFEFDLEGSGAVGSFVVLPPHNKPSTFKELCQINSVTYDQGEGYYALKRKEEISEKKDMILHNSINDTFIIGHADVCKKLNQPHDERIVLKPEDIPIGFRLFVQSTSHNRKIPEDTHVLVKVSMKEALKFRHAAKYSFK